MSVSLWRYTEDCDGNPCPGDCDLCNKEPEWIKDPDRPRAMRFKCPYCGDYCYDNFYADNKTIKCSYQFCPHCGKEIEPKKKQNDNDNKHRPLCLARVFAYEVGRNLACEECPVKCDYGKIARSK